MCEECFICKKLTNSLVGDPGEWPLKLEYKNGNGETRIYHRRCVLNAIDSYVIPLDPKEI